MEKKIIPALKYNLVNDLWIISSFYNSHAYVTKPKNFEKFIQNIDDGNLNYLIVECAFGKQSFTLPKKHNIIRVRTSDIMWQKERLLNIALENLPSKCKKIAWVDCDVLFENADWAKETSEKLKYAKVVQPFKQAIRLPPNTDAYSGIGERYNSFGFVMKKNPYIVCKGRFDLHGHTGFAWASHKSIFQKYGFYDSCIAGSGDHMMAHSFIGDWSTNCLGKILGKNSFFYKHYVEWSKKIYPLIKSKIDYTDGTLLHLWHGNVEDRKYVLRQKALEEYGFNPWRDLTLNESNCWKWNHDKQEIKDWAKEYFVLRKEDQLINA
jgi:hypothetical protein